MPEIANVATAAIIDVAWGNAIRDRTAQRYDNVATRTAENATPTDGDVAFMQDTGDLAVYFTGAWRNIVPAGTMIMNASNSTPPGWITCQGQAISRTTYAALFAAIGVVWGVGDGSTTFNVPDMRQRFPMGVAASGTGNTLGASAGNIDHTHTVPAHGHGPLNPTQALGGTPAVGGNASSGTDHTHAISVDGAGVTSLNNPPLKAVHFLIKT